MSPNLHAKKMCGLDVENVVLHRRIVDEASDGKRPFSRGVRVGTRGEEGNEFASSDLHNAEIIRPGDVEIMTAIVELGLPAKTLMGTDDELSPELRIGAVAGGQL